LFLVILHYRLLGGTPRELPHPDNDFVRFEAAIKALQDASPKIVNPLNCKEDRWINLAVLRSKYGGDSGCIIS
jgi:hypothetical protein